MMMELTAKQQTAVNERNKNILVSAAAGSGKTSVLTERITKLCEEGADIRRMLVCTFTNAAAAEMRSRISKRLLARAEDANDARLRAQAEYAAVADICTFHSFCIRLLKEHFLQAGLRQRWRVASEKTAAQLMEQALEDTFDTLSEAGDNRLRMLQKRYTGSSEASFKENLLDLYAFTCSLPEQLEWIVRMDKNAAAEKCRELYLKKYTDAADRMIAAYAECLNISTAQGWQKQSANDAAELQAAERTAAAIAARDHAALSELLAKKAPAKDGKRPKGEVLDKHDFFLKLARAERTELKEIAPDDLGRIAREAEYLSDQADALYHVLSVFREKYRLLKADMGVLDYDDILSESYKLLENEEIAAEYRAHYDYIFVDEYQDTNPIQEAFISRIVRSDNAFMVGDIKQSIYRFRLADPLIFRERQQRYDNAAENGELLIRMNDNFRSAPAVIGGINRAMSRLMSREFGEIDYTDDEALIAGGEGQAEGAVEFLLTTAEERTPSAREEAENIARRILDLHQTDGISYKDIAVLMRATKGDGDLFAKVFAEHGIPCINNAERSVPGEAELFLNLLRIVDNVNYDIPLIAVMRSHVGGFDEQALAEIRANSLHGSFYQAVKLTAENEDALGGRCAEFLQQIRLLRIYARSMRLRDFLILLKARTNFEERLILLPHGIEKAEVFRRFYEDCLANAEEKESLYHLLQYYDALIKRGDSIVGKKETLGDHDCVQIMTVHKSKGLEFPVVFFARLGKRLRKDDIYKNFIYTSELGVVSDIYEEDTRVKRSSLMKEVIGDLIEDQLRSEALRVVYVAMTRAKERLILSGAIKKESMDPTAQQCIAAMRYGHQKTLDTPLKWLIAAYSDEEFLDWNGLTVREYADKQETEVDTVSITVAEVLGAIAASERKPLPICQPDCSPLKYGVSALLPEYDFETATAPQPAHAAGGTEFGSLVHYFMEHADFANFEGVHRQLERMRRAQLITAAEAVLLRRFSEQIERFFEGETAKRIRRSQRVYRELPFNLSVSARSVGKDADGDIIIQGIIDLLFEEDGKWVIVDYKSNFVTEENIRGLIEHYTVQMDLYRRAAEMISGRAVDECVLCFLRAGREERIVF